MRYVYYKYFSGYVNLNSPQQLHYLKWIILVKSKELLADLVTGNGYGAAALARKVHALA